MNLKDILIGLNSMAVVCTDDGAAIEGAIELLKSQAATIANFQGHLGIDKKPEGHNVVEVCFKTMCSDMKSCLWSILLPNQVQDWHLWRPRFRSDDSVLARSEEIRRQLGVTDKVDGFYRLPDEDTP